MDEHEHAPWWRGARGEWYVVAQVFLFAFVALGPPNWPGAGPWPPRWSLVASAVGVALVVAGAALALGGVARLGAYLTPLPYPRQGAPLRRTGAYAIVRHPIYGGLVIAFFGWGLVRNGVLTLIYALVTLVFFDVKSRLEERWLCERYPDYADYQRRVKKLIPWVY
jgi:protein-S-isoprenylcysteine O-methyltransferase Ste14